MKKKRNEGIIFIFVAVALIIFMMIFGFFIQNSKAFSGELVKVEKLTPSEKLLLREAKKLIDEAYDYYHSVRDEIGENHDAPCGSYGEYYNFEIKDNFILIYSDGD